MSKRTKVITELDRRKAAIDEISKCVLVDRYKSHGPAENNFSALANILNVVLQRKLKSNLDALDVASILLSLKLARIAHNPHHLDNWTDAGGYSVCGASLVKGAEDGR